MNRLGPHEDIALCSVFAMACRLELEFASPLDSHGSGYVPSMVQPPPPPTDICVSVTNRVPP